MNHGLRYNRKEHQRCQVIPRMEALWLRPLSTGGSLTATRRPSRTAVADSIVTFGVFVVIYAAWVGGARRAGACPRRLGFGLLPLVGRDDPARHQVWDIPSVGAGHWPALPLTGHTCGDSLPGYAIHALNHIPLRRKNLGHIGNSHRRRLRLGTL